MAGSNEDEVVLDGKIYAVIAYLSFFCFIPLIVKKDNPYVLFHGKQGLVLFIGQSALLVFGIIFGIGFIKLGFFVLGSLSVFGMISVVKGKYTALPVISEFAKQIKL